ncbi:MAG: DUF484 family protein [Proteobacteria bacterium]|nr:DUF484 family protein [Pseudomonadota bacterium]
MSPAKEPKATAITAEQVREYLKRHPDFLHKNSDLVEEIAPPERELGDGVIDFQHFMVKNLQKDSKGLKQRYELLVDFCRENMSVQSQVHGAALKLMRAKGLETLLEIISTDLLTLFDVDVVRMAMESDVPVDTSYGDENYSGFVFIPTGTVDGTLGENKNVLLVEDTTEQHIPGLAYIFSDCEGLVASCALLRLDLETVGKQVLLAFGVRHKNRYHAGQGVELLYFLAQVLALQLDMYLIDLSM